MVVSGRGEGRFDRAACRGYLSDQDSAFDRPPRPSAANGELGRLPTARIFPVWGISLAPTCSCAIYLRKTLGWMRHPGCLIFGDGL
jgi:hypothetical protein